MQDDARRVTLGRVSGVFGIRGWVKVQSFTRPIDNLLGYPDWWLERERSSSVRLLEGRAQGGSLVVRLAREDGTPIEDRDQAAALIGSEVQVQRSALPELDEDEVYWADLIGCEVVNEQAVWLGVIEDVTSNGAQDVIVVVEQREPEPLRRLIPFVRGVLIKQVDVSGRRVVADWQPDY